MSIDHGFSVSAHPVAGPATSITAADDGFRAVLNQTMAAMAETPDSPGQAGRPTPATVNGETSNTPSTQNAGGTPPGGRPPRVATAAPDPDDLDNVMEMKEAVAAATILTWPDHKIDQYANAIRDARQTSLPRWLETECDNALEKLGEAGAIPRPPPAALARVANAPALGPKAGAAIAALITSLSQDQLRALPQAQRDSLFAKFHTLRALPDLATRVRELDVLAIEDSCTTLARAGSALIASHPPTQQEQSDLAASQPEAAAKIVAAMPDSELHSLTYWPMLADVLLGANAPRGSSIPAAAQTQATRILDARAVPSDMQPLIDTALERFPHTDPALRIMSVGSTAPGGQAVAVTTGAVPDAMVATLADPDGVRTTDVTIQKMSPVMDGYAVAKNTDANHAIQVRLPGTTSFTKFPGEAMAMVPPGTEIEVGQKYRADYARFTLPPL